MSPSRIIQLFHFAFVTLEILGIFLATPGFFLTGDPCLAYCRNKRNCNLIRTVEEGTQPELKLTNWMMSIFLDLQLKFGHSVIYVDVPSNVKDFGKAFGKAINFAFEEHIALQNRYGNWAILMLIRIRYPCHSPR
ncbi:hypothetical protein Glove_346g166 [Diversispora epigaea]|uniref:Uncharacterized protein n=1 Tax=Diversispora epigaea TaxID=1348612 RepID=A0A397HHY8_9GLOM|nr:hypothetical protein Glove_346g166 [Diversispora epigaea]